jgi:transposase
VLVDESGFMLQPVVRRTWALRGKTPVHRSWDRHDRLSVISVLTISPQRRRLGLYFAIKQDNIRAPDAERFIRALRRQLGGKKLLLVWDRLNVHRSAAPRLLRNDGVVIEWLPAYAPDLNPVEQVWRHAKYVDLANFLPIDLKHLTIEVAVSLTQLGARQPLLHRFFAHAGLSI